MNTKIIESTISGNTGGLENGGAYITSNSITLSNSTIAFNTSGTGTPGVSFFSFLGGNAHLVSNIISNNTYGSSNTPNDLSSDQVNVTGSNNLIFAPSTSVPTDTLVGKCPLLAPLANNGGSVQTHALRGHSPAIDTGLNPNSDSYDERGSPYLRTSGSPGTTPLPDKSTQRVF